MKILRVALLFMCLLAFSRSGNAQLSTTCNSQLRALIVPSLKGRVMKKKDIQVELADSEAGVYSVRLFVPADSPENLDRQVAIGWVNLDVNSMKVFDVTNDPDNPIDLNVQKNSLQSFVKKCLK